MDELSQSHSAEAINAAKNAQEAIEKARESQIHSAVKEAISEFFDRGVQEKKFVDIGRIPFICDDIKKIHTSIDNIKGDMRWIKWLGGGFVAAAGMLALKSLGI